MIRVLVAAAATAAIAAIAPAQQATELIPRETLFGNPDRAGVQISPDGEHLAFLAPVDGVLNVWVAPADDPDAASPVTKDDNRGVRRYFWSYDNEHILYLQDRGGDENWSIFAAHIDTRETRNLTPIDVIPGPDGRPITGPDGNPLRPTAQVQHVSHKRPGQILIGLNNRDPRWHDIHLLDLASGRLTLVEQNNGYAGFVTNDDYDVVLAQRPTADGGWQLFRRSENNTWEPWQKIPSEDSLTTSPLQLRDDGEAIYMLDSRDRDTAALVEVELDTERTRVLATDARADIQTAIFHPVTNKPQAAASVYDRQRWQVLDPELHADFQILRNLADGEFSISSRTLNDQRWIVASVVDNGPVRYYLYDRPTREAQFLFTNRPELEGLDLARMHPVVIDARDGLPLVSYYTLPVASDTDADAFPDNPLPMVLVVHGGPWARDAWGYNAMHQWLANRGYAVMSVNFRGSTGFGKDFVNAGNREWGAKMHDDLVDAVDWAIDNGIADPDAVAIMGGSYGGYATLAGLTFTPDKFAAGVSIVGPSNLVTLLNSIPPYWASFRDQFRERVGDIDTPEGRALLRNRSPLTHVDEINKPLLIGQGANDPRVKQAESDQIVDAMNEKNLPVTYVLYPDEGHGFARPENRLSFFAVAEAFLAPVLGGAYEPIRDDFDDSSITVPEGQEHVPGLSGALDNAAD